MAGRRICVVVTARPSYARIKTVLQAIDEHPELELQLVVGASALLERYGRVVNVMRSDGFEPDATIYMLVEGENLVTMAKSTGLGIVELVTAFDNLRPDAVMTVADRYETLASAVAASYLNIPVVHVQGGEVTGSIDDKVRHAVTKLANVHFVANDACADRIIRMGEEASSVYVTGCPSIDLAATALLSGKLDFDPFDRYPGVGAIFDTSEPFVVVLQHPVTTEHERARQQIEETLHAIRDVDVHAFWFWPNVDAGSDETSKGIRSFREMQGAGKIHFVKNMSPEDFLNLLIHARCVVGNSSVALRECSFLGVPAVNIGARQQGRDRSANVLDVQHERQAIARCIKTQMTRGRLPTDRRYGDGRAGERIARHLADIELTSDKRMTY